MDLKLSESKNKEEVYEINFLSPQSFSSNSTSSHKNDKIYKNNKSFDFYISNLDGLHRKEEVKIEFLKFGRIRELSVKKSSLTKYYLAHIRLELLQKSSDDMITDLHKR